jgi:hypothetical protein
MRLTAQAALPTTTLMDANQTDSLFTDAIPSTQAERWEMAVGIMDHLIGTTEDKSSIVSRTIANPDDGSHAINEGMERVGQLINLIRKNPSTAAIPDRFKARASSMVESEAYHTLVVMHSATKPQPGVDHYTSIINTITGPNANRTFWDAVPSTLPRMWAETKAVAEMISPVTVRPLPSVPRVGQMGHSARPFPALETNAAVAR